MTDTIPLNAAYAIRAYAIQWIAERVDADCECSQSDVVAEIARRYPDLPAGTAEHLAERIMACWGMAGLDYEEAPTRPGSTSLREWYPVVRDGQLERVPFSDLTGPEMDGVIAGLKVQAQEAKRGAAALQGYLADGRA